jgi:hypothetical protein
MVYLFDLWAWHFSDFDSCGCFDRCLEKPMKWTIRKLWLKWCIAKTRAQQVELDRLYQWESRLNHEALTHYMRELENLGANQRAEAIGRLPV